MWCTLTACGGWRSFMAGVRVGLRASPLAEQLDLGLALGLGAIERSGFRMTRASRGRAGPSQDFRHGSRQRTGPA